MPYPMCRNGLHEMTPENTRQKKDARVPKGYVESCKECSKEHSHKRRDADRGRPCKVCPKPVNSVDPRKQYCSLQCSRVFNSRNYRGKTVDADVLEQRNYRRNIRRARARLSPEQFEVWEADMAAKWQKEQAKASSPMNLLAIKGSAQEALDELNKAMEAQRTNCFERPEDFMDFDDPRYPDEWDATKPRPVPDLAKMRLLCEDCPVAALCQNYAEIAQPDFGVYNGQLYVGGKPVAQ